MKSTLKTQRLHQHFSQQELAQQSGISLRTIQRIESGVSKGSPYVIRKLCGALHINPQDLVFTETAPEVETMDESGPSQQDDIAGFRYDRRVKYINFSVLSVLCFPFLNLVIPAVLYFIFKKMLPDRRDKTAILKILDLQIFWVVTTLIALIVIPLIDHYFFDVGHVLEIPLFLWGYLLLVIVLVLLTLKTASDINKMKDLLVFVPDIL